MMSIDDLGNHGKYDSYSNITKAPIKPVEENTSNKTENDSAVYIKSENTNSVVSKTNEDTMRIKSVSERGQENFSV